MRANLYRLSSGRITGVVRHGVDLEKEAGFNGCGNAGGDAVLCVENGVDGRVSFFAAELYGSFVEVGSDVFQAGERQAVA